MRVRGAAALLLLGLAAASAAAQQDLTGRAILSYQIYEMDELLAKGFHQQYDLNWERQVTDPLRLRLAFRGEGIDGSSDLEGMTTTNRLRQLQPNARLDYILPALQLSGTYDLIRTNSDSGDVESDRTLQRITESLSFGSESLPFLTFQAEQRSRRASPGGVDDRENFLTETLGWTWKSLSLSQIGRYATYDQNATGFDRKTYDLQGLAKYDGSFFEGRATAAATALFGVTRLEETNSAGTSVSAPNRVLIMAASYVVDDTPAESRDHPLVPLPGLIDGNLTRGAGISVGPTGVSFQNIGVDMGRYLALDMFRIYVRDAEEKLVPYGGLVRWDVWTSGDAIEWTPVRGGSQTSYVASLGAYEVSFPSTTSRYFKLVSFGTNATDTLVTEIEVFFRSAYAPRETRTTDTRFISGNATLSGKPAGWLNLSYWANVNDYRTSRSDGLEYPNNDIDQLVSAEFIASKVLSATFRYENRRVSADTLHQTFNGVWGILTATFNPNLVTTLEASRTDDENALSAKIDTVRFHSYARFFPSLDLSLDVGVSKGRYGGSLPDTDQKFLTAVSYAQLTDSLKLTLSASLQRTSFPVTAAGPPGLPEARNDRWYGEVFYRPGPQLLLSGRIGYVTGSVVSGMTKALRVEWYPFAGGTFGIGTIFDEDVESNGSFRRFRRVQILPRWMINRHATLDVNFNWLTLRDELPGAPPLDSRMRQLYLNLTLTL